MGGGVSAGGKGGSPSGTLNANLSPRQWAHSAGVQSSGYANSESQPAAEGGPSDWFPLREGIKAGIEERAPSLCALVSPKTNASSFLMEALWRWVHPEEQMVTGTATGGPPTRAHSRCFRIINR